MLEEMRVRNYSPRTITTYISMVATMSKHFAKSPDLITSGELKDYLFQKVSRDQLSPSTINQIISAFKILQVDILGNEWDSLKIRRPKTPKTLPVVFSKEEVSIILGRLKNRKHHCLIALTYAAGLRLNEVVHLKPSDLDSKRMQIRIRAGKGNKDRYTLLPAGLLVQLREYYRLYRPEPIFSRGSLKAVPTAPEAHKQYLKKPSKLPGLPNRLLFTPFDILLPLISWSREPVSVSSRTCLDTAHSRPLRFISTYASLIHPRSRVRWTCSDGNCQPKIHRIRTGRCLRSMRTGFSLLPSADNQPA